MLSHGLLPPFLLLLLLLSLFSVTYGFGPGNIGIPVCPVGDCGDGIKIPYPFWLSNGSSASFCGYPELKITCNGSNSSFRTSTGNYTVKSIDAQKQILSLIDTDAIGNHSCPRARRNVSLDGNPSLNFSSANRYLDFFFNCDLNQLKGLDNISSGHVVSCLKNVSGTSLVFYREQLAEYGSGLSSACDNETVESPVLGGALLNDGDLSASFAAAMNGGFELVWKYPGTENCWSCEDSGGYCGYGNERGKGLEFQCFCGDGVHYGSDCRGSGKGVGAGEVVVALIIVMLIFLILKTFWPWSSRNSQGGSDQNVEAFLSSDGLLAVRRYTSYQLRRMTHGYSTELGKGGYGTVYKGALPDGTLVAVKLLKGTKETGDEFINEVASIGRTNHVNVVSLLGFCSERESRALVYEFMPNGSLEKYLFTADSPTTGIALLGWEQLQHIAVGIAKGLEYLHKGCNTRMVHFDIKPHNILLDKDFCPKISDFGLAKLHNDNHSYLSSMLPRGTIGYIAPEVFSRNFGVVSSKSDVYSYGMMVLEMVGGRRRKANPRVLETSDQYFPRWIYEHLGEEDSGLRECGVAAGSEETARKMVLVGLWCIQPNPSSRPPISKVVEMLEGSIDHLEMPPKPYLCSPGESSNTWEVDSFPTMSKSL